MSLGHSGDGLLLLFCLHPFDVLVFCYGHIDSPSLHTNGQAYPLAAFPVVLRHSGTMPHLAGLECQEVVPLFTSSCAISDPPILPSNEVC